MKLRVLIATAVLTGLAASTHAIDFYVAQDGSDTNSGLTRASAKATIAAGYALLEHNAAATVGARLILGDGEWTSTDFGTTLVLSNGWSLVGEHGREKTTLKVLAADFRFFTLASADSAVRSLTIDYNRGGKVTYKTSAIEEPKGTIDDCNLINYYSTWTAGSSGMVRISNNSAIITNCVFRKCQNVYNGPSAIWLSLGANAKIIDCTFIDCVSGSADHSAGGTIFSYRGVATIRNCLFLRSIVYGAKASNYGSNCGVVGCGVSSSNLTVENCTFAECRIYRNSVAGMAGNNSSAGTITIRNCLAFGNANDDGPIGFVTARGTISYCAADVEPTGAGTFSNNSLISPANTIWQNVREDRYIPTTGPAVDGGIMLNWMTDAKDILGTDRIVGSAPDIGCYEFRRPATYYVAKDGNDANPGTSRALAKATLAAGHSLLSGYDETLVLGDGEWETSEPIVLSNGWTLVSENGRGVTTLAPSALSRAFVLASPGTCVRDITVDFKRRAYSSNFYGALANNPQGIFDGCAISNLYSRYVAYVSLVDIGSSTVDAVFTNCLFANSNASYRRALFWLEQGRASFLDCSFIECEGYNRFDGNSRKYYNYGMVYIKSGSSLFRNCLFLRCTAFGRYDNASATYASVVTCASDSGTVLENCSFIDCVVPNGIGGALAWATPGNVGTGGGTAVNCFAYGCSNSVEKANLMNGFSYSHCASDKLVPGEANVVLTDANFSYRNKRNGDFTVKRGPTIDAGTNLTWMADAVDLMGRPRIIGKSVDIGCFELETSRATRFMVR